MAQQTQENFISPAIAELNSRIADIEEKQRLLRDRILLIGKNIVELREQITNDATEIKIKQEEMINDIERLKAGFLRIGEEVDKKARKTELAILEKQLKIFSPLETVRMQDIDKILKEKLKEVKN